MEFTILPGKNPPIEKMELYDRSFEFWFQNWSQFFQRQDPLYVLSPNEFFRQDYFGVIHELEVPVAVHLYSIFDLRSDSIKKHDYLRQNFSSSFLEHLKKTELSFVMSFESMMIDSKYRKKTAGNSLAPILYSQGIQFLKSLKFIDAMVAPARADVGVAQLAQSGGCEVIENIDLHGTPVSLVCGLRDNLHLNFLSFDQKEFAVQLFNQNNHIQHEGIRYEFNRKSLAS